MKKLLSLLLVLVLCLSLCACGENNNFWDEKPEDNTAQTGEVNNNEDVNNRNSFYALRGSDANEFALYAPEYWTIEGDLDLPANLAFEANGTCVATYLDRTEYLYWGYAPSKMDIYNLYVRIGTQEEVLYLFHVHYDKSNYLGSIARHCFVSADGIPIDGLPEDGYELNWISATKHLPASSENNEQNTDNSQEIPDNSEESTDSYEQIELTAENWDVYFELTETFAFSKNLFGENNRLDIIHRYKLKDGYGAIGEETNIIIEYSYCAEVRKNCVIDFSAGSYTLSEELDSRHEASQIVDYSYFSDEGYGHSLGQSYNYDPDRIRYCTDFQILRVQGTLYLKKN